MKGKRREERRKRRRVGGRVGGWKGRRWRTGGWRKMEEDGGKGEEEGREDRRTEK